MTSENEIFELGIRALEDIGLQILRCESPGNARADLALKLKPKNSEKTFDYLVTIKSNINNANLSQWLMERKLRDDAPGNPALLTRYVPASMAEKLREMEISFFDTVGNAYFDNPPLYVYVTGRKATELKPKPLSLFRPAGMKLVLYLLNERGLEENDYREIAEQTGVPKSTVGELMNDLERLQFLTFYKGRRRLANRPGLLDRWVEAFTESYRPKLVRARFRTPEARSGWWKSASILEYQGCWGGEIAARKLVGHIRPDEVTIYADSLLPRLQAEFGLRRDPNGDVTLLKKFWNDSLDEIAPPLVVYADLISNANARDLETAQMIYEKYLDRLVKDPSK